MKKILVFLNLLDSNKNLSITNCLVIAMTIKVLTLPEIDTAGFAAFFTAVVAYRFKSYETKKFLKND